MNDQQQSRADALTDRIDDAIYRHIPPKVALENAKALYAMGIELLTAAPADGACKRCGSTTAQSCNDAGCFYLESGDGEPSAVPADERAAFDLAEFCELIDAYQCAQKDGTHDERAKARFALMNAYRAAASLAAEAVAFEVTEEIAADWAKRHDIEHVLKHHSTQRNAIEDARTLHLIDAPQPAHAEAASPAAEEMRDAAMRTVQAMGLVYTPGSDRWRPNPNHAPAAAAASPAAAIPAGWKLVPIEPTEEMIAVGIGKGDADFYGDPLVKAEVRSDYQAMIAAAPSPVRYQILTEEGGWLDVPQSYYERFKSDTTLTRAIPAAPQPAHADAPAEAREPQWCVDIIADLQGLFDTEGITENDSGDALIRLSDAIEAVKNAKSSAPADAGEAAPFGWARPKGGNYFTRNELSAKRIGGLVPVYAAPPASRMARLTDAARDMLAERRRQVEAEGWTPKHDDEHDKGEMARAAACYALHAGSCFAWRADEYQSAKPHEGNPAAQDRLWPWDMQWWKPKDPRRDLVRAGALILAELERLDRAALLNGADQ